MATIYQDFGYPIATNAPIKLSVDLGNTGLGSSDLLVYMSKNAAALASVPFTVAELGRNLYAVELSAGTNDTAGPVCLSVSAVVNQTNVSLMAEANAKTGGQIYTDIGAATLKVTPASNSITAGTIANDAITAAKIATGAIDADALATDAVTEIKDAVWNAILSGYAGAGSAGKIVNDMVTSVWAAGTRELTGLGAGAVASIWNALTSGMITAGSIGKRISDNLDAVLSTSATAITAIKAKTDKLTYDGSNNVYSTPQTNVTVATASKDAIVDALCVENINTHAATANSVAEALRASRGLSLGKRVITGGGLQEDLYDKDNVTKLATFTLTLDASANVTQRTT